MGDLGFLAGVEFVAVEGAGFHGELGYGLGVGGDGAAEGHVDFAEFGSGGFGEACGGVAVGEEEAVAEAGGDVGFLEDGADGSGSLFGDGDAYGGALRVGGGGVALDVADGLNHSLPGLEEWLPAQSAVCGYR